MKLQYSKFFGLTLALVLSGTFYSCSEDGLEEEILEETAESEEETETEKDQTEGTLTLADDFILDVDRKLVNSSIVKNRLRCLFKRRW